MVAASPHRSKPTRSSSVAGPVGLFQVFELGLLEIPRARDRLARRRRRQCVELYPDKPIYDIPAVPVCTGQELTDSLLKQIEPFARPSIWPEVTLLKKDGRWPLLPADLATGTRS